MRQDIHEDRFYDQKATGFMNGGNFQDEGEWVEKQRCCLVL